MWSLNYGTDEPIYNRNRLTGMENRHEIAKGEGRKGRNGLRVYD